MVQIPEKHVPAAKCGEVFSAGGFGLFKATDAQMDAEQVLYVQTGVGHWLPTTTRDKKHVVLERTSPGHEVLSCNPS